MDRSKVVHEAFDSGWMQTGLSLVTGALAAFFTASVRLARLETRLDSIEDLLREARTDLKALGRHHDH
jgi:hypothetical protein